VKQIRLCWTAQVSHIKHEIQTTADWTVLTPYLRRDYEIMVRAGNEVFGAGTHWIEERDTPQADIRRSTPRHNPLHEGAGIRCEDAAQSEAA